MMRKNYFASVLAVLVYLIQCNDTTTSSTDNDTRGRSKTLFPVEMGLNLFQFCANFYESELEWPPNSLCQHQSNAYVLYYNLSDIPDLSFSTFQLESIGLQDAFLSSSGTYAMDHLRSICQSPNSTNPTSSNICNSADLAKKDFQLMFFAPKAYEKNLRTSRHLITSPPTWPDFYRRAQQYEERLQSNRLLLYQDQLQLNSKNFLIEAPDTLLDDPDTLLDQKDLGISENKTITNGTGKPIFSSHRPNHPEYDSDTNGLLQTWPLWTLAFYDDEERNIDFGSKLKEIVERWHHEASINYGLSNIKRLMLPLLVLESPALPQKTEQDLLKAYDTSERRRQLLFYLNYTQEDTCKRPLASSSSKWLPKNQTRTTCQVQEKCRKLCGLDCYFNSNEDCYWTWDADNYTEEADTADHKPGQNGFIRLDSGDVKRYYNKWPGQFFGPYLDPNNYTGSFLYLLGQPRSDVANFTDKRVISELIRETGNNCTVTVTMRYQNIEGAVVEFGTQNLAKAYSAIKFLTFTRENRTSMGWKTFPVKFGRYLDPFSISIDIRRSQKSEYGSFFALDSIRLHNCEPESSVPIDCSQSPSRYYVCPRGEGVSCMDGPSMLCDLAPDCPGGSDEQEEACLSMPEGSRCDFNKGVCGWRVPSQIPTKSGPSWKIYKGKSELGDIDGDINFQHPSRRKNGQYLYVGYRNEVTDFSGASLRSPTFPPPPKYNNNASSPLYSSCRVRLYYNAKVDLSLSTLEVMVMYFNESKVGGSSYYSTPMHSLTRNYRMDMKTEGWQRWEALLDPNIQLRYAIMIQAINGMGTKSEFAIDNFSLSPQCFGLGVPPELLEGWHANMTDLELCKYYGGSDCVQPRHLHGYYFSTCGNGAGPLGPYTQQCENAYRDTSVAVEIGDSSKKERETHSFGYVTGIQRWKVPKTGLYTLIVSGASGGESRRNRVQSKGDQIRALVQLEANETLFISVGQMGGNHAGIILNSRCYTLRRHKRDVFDSTSSYNRNNNFGNPAVGHSSNTDGVHKIYNLLSLKGKSGANNNVAHLDYDYIMDYEASNSIASSQDHFDGTHGRIHQSPDTHGSQNSDYFKDLDSKQLPPTPGGGGGGGATAIFRLLNGGEIVQPLLIAAGGGGSSSAPSPNRSPDAQGLIDPWDTLESWKNHVSTEDKDAGSGGGWNASLTLFANFSVIYPSHNECKNRTQPTGFSAHWSWIGGMPCNPQSNQYGGFGGGGGGCFGGGGGGGFIGGNGGVGVEANGEGGFSYYNPEAVLLLLDSRLEFAPSSSASHHHRKSKRLAKLWKSSGPGFVHILPQMADHSCQANCSELGAVCLSLNQDLKLTRCVCPNGVILDHMNPKCSESMSNLMVILIVVICIVVAAFLGLACLILHTQYQRRFSQKMRRKALYGPDSQLHRLRALNGTMGPNGNGGGILMTEYNPNYEFGGGTCTLQDLKEIPRDQLRLVKGIGQGAFGEVYQGFYKKAANDPLEMAVAVKTLPEMSSNQAELDFLMEALIMSKFNHPNIVHFIGVCFEKHPRFILLELLAGGDLKSFLRESRPKPDRPSPLVMKDLLLCAMDVAKGCEYLEGNHFIHRDIAARNCLLTTKGPGRVVKIADFGMARDIYRADYYRKGGKAMLPVKWMPPEAFLDGIFTSKTDIWSFGILMWEVMSLGYMPYPGRGNQEVMQLVTNGGRLEPPNFCPGPVYGLMCQCWHPIPEERPTFRTIIERLGYCLQDPEVVMAPLPLFHRPLSQDNSRDTSLSSGRGGGRSTGPDTSGSGGGVSLPMRGQTKTPTTPDTPSTVMTGIPNAASSDYLIPLASNLPSGGKRSKQRRSVTSQSTQHGSTPNSDSEELIHHSKTKMYDNEAETSFCSPPAPNRVSSSSSAGYSNVRALPHSANTKPKQTSAVELPLHITSVIDSGILPSPPNTHTNDSPIGAPPPPPPKGYGSRLESPDFPPLPPLPPDAEEDEERHPLMSSLDVNALPNSNVPSPQVLMDNPREVIGVSNNRSNLHRKEPVYTITSVSASGTQVVPPKDPPPSEISV